MGLTLVTPPTVWPVTLAEAKTQVRVTHTAEDSYISTLIKAATRYVEQTLSMSIAEQTWQLTLDAFADAIELPRGPVQSVDEFEYLDSDGLPVAVSDDLYTADFVSRSPWLVLNSGESWPTTLDAVNVVAITYTAGMETVPEDLRHAILVQIQLLYERGSDPKIAEYQQKAVESLLGTYRAVLV